MFYRKRFYSKIEKIHHRTLKVIYGIDDSYAFYYAFYYGEIFKSISQISPKFMWFSFKQKKLPYNLRKGPILNLPRA